jgi:type IV secretion system protein VirB10
VSADTPDRPQPEAPRPDLPQPEPPEDADAGQPLTGEPDVRMRLRPEQPRVMRRSRKVLAGLGVVASAGIGAALVYALQTQHHAAPASEELYSANNNAKPDSFNALPKDYTGPKLGPPLPGDVGRMMFNAQIGGSSAPATGTAASASAAPSAEEQRRGQEIEAARLARLFASTDTRPANNGAAVSPATTATPQTDLASLGLAPQASTPNAQDRQSAFLNQTPDKRTVAPDRVAAPASPNILQAGAVIPAAMITGIRSDLPGQITAQVTENVYDSPTGRILLIPQGTRVVGQYDNNVGFGQSRVLMVWNRLIFPNGHSIVLERQPGADAEGYAGLEDGVDYHWGDLFKAAVLSTILSVGAEAGTSNNENSLVQALRSGASNSISQTGQQIVSKQLNIAPTLTIRPGFPVRIMVTHDLVLENYGG